jgi:Carboxypeptidase regulatory-like domain
MSCVPEGANVRCVASAYNIDIASQDVTGTGEWLFTGAGGTFAQPGLFVPASHGEVTIWVTYRGHETATKSTFLVGPNEPAQRLYWVAGSVLDATSRERISGAAVSILDGYAAGKSAITNENGSYRIETVLTGEVFTATASKAGYQSVSRTYRVDSPIGPGGSNPPFLDFELSR